jgi:hypothetical protein
MPRESSNLLALEELLAALGYAASDFRILCRGEIARENIELERLIFLEGTIFKSCV